jgi:hypothetical protein
MRYENEICTPDLVVFTELPLLFSTTAAMAPRPRVCETERDSWLDGSGERASKFTHELGPLLDSLRVAPSRENCIKFWFNLAKKNSIGV